MAIVNKQIVDLLTGDPNTTFRTTMLTVPSGEEWAITNIMVCNTFDPAGTNPEQEDCVFDLHLVSNDSSFGVSTMVVRRLNLPAGETFTFDTEKIVLVGGDAVIIDGSQSTNNNENLSCTVSYIKVL
jgi:hypothetical protein